MSFTDEGRTSYSEWLIEQRQWVINLGNRELDYQEYKLLGEKLHLVEKSHQDGTLSKWDRKRYHQLSVICAMIKREAEERGRCTECAGTGKTPDWILVNGQMIDRCRLCGGRPWSGSPSSTRTVA